MKQEIAVLQKNARLNQWYEDICQCKQSGLVVEEWCARHNLNRNTYYDRYKMVMRALEERYGKGKGCPI